MRESLYDRFRPFKPYDLALALVLLALVAVQVHASLEYRALLVIGGLASFAVLELFQHLVRVPTPFRQALAIVLVNTVAVTALNYLDGSGRFTLAFYMLNIAFATVAFGMRIGLIAALLSVAILAPLDFFRSEQPRPLTEWPLFLVVLWTLVAILARINRLQQDALYDAVTGLRNHRYFQVRLREELIRTERTGQPTSLILLDLDDFKKINDRFGHAVGDAVLSQVARILEQTARAGDIVCRYGGEEMVVLLPGTALAEGAQVAERLRLAVERRNDRPGPAVTISLGVAACPEHARQSDPLIVAADAAMYSAKRAGKNRVVSAPVNSPTA